MAGNNLDEAQVIDGAVAKACADAGVADGSVLRQKLINDATVYDLVEVCVPDDDGKSVSLSTRLSQLKGDARWRSEFSAAKPAPPGRPAATPAGAMLTPTRSQFDEIVSGKSVVR
jgi:hypothetical protein